MTKRILAVLLAALMVLAMFAGCNAGSGSESTTAAGTTKANTTAATTKATTAAPKDESIKVTEPGTLPVVEGGLTLSIAMPQNSVVEDRETNVLFNYIQEQSGITLDLQEFPSDEYSTKLDLMMAAGGDDLPAILAGGSIGVGPRTSWGEAGHILDLKPYMEDWCYYLPIAYNNCEYTDWETALMQVSSSNGAIYGMPSYAESPNDRVSSGRINFYVPWVEKAGMYELDENGELFRTVDEVLAYYDAVKTGDFNGNGANDEICLTGYGTSNLKYAFLPMFLETNPDAFYIDTAENCVKFNFDREEYKEGLKFIKSLVDNGYLDPLTFTQDHTIIAATITAETMTVASFMRISASNLNDTTVPAFSEFQWASALAAPGETAENRYQFYSKAIPYVQYFVTKNCESVEAAVRLGDYWGSAEVSFMNNCGFEGEDYDMVADLEGGADKYTNFWGWDLSEVYVRRTAETGGRASWGTMQNVWMSNQGVSCLDYKWATSSGFEKSNPRAVVEGPSAQRIQYEMNLTNQDNVLAGQVYTAEEVEINQDVWAPINTYIGECFSRFCMGDLDIEADWDSYVDELYAMGLQDVIDSENQCYDRMYK